MSPRILLCVDGSRCSMAATRVAVDLLERLPGAHLTALHVVDVATPEGLIQEIGSRLGLGPTVVDDEGEARARQYGQQILDQVEALAGERPVQLLLRQGPVEQVLLTRAAHADLVILGATGLTEEVHPKEGGRQVVRLLQESSAPVLFVPEGVQRCTTALVGYDGSVAAARGVGALRRVFEGCPIPVHAVHVGADHGVGILAEVDADLPGFQVHHHAARGEPVHQVLVQEAMRLEVDLLVMGFRERRGLRGLLYSTSSEHILGHASVALLVAH